MLNKTSALLFTRMERRNTDLTLSNIYCKEILLQTTCSLPFRKVTAGDRNRRNVW